jgi:hypothetical protein
VICDHWFADYTRVEVWGTAIGSGDFLLQWHPLRPRLEHLNSTAHCTRLLLDSGLRITAPRAEYVVLLWPDLEHDRRPFHRLISRQGPPLDHVKVPHWNRHSGATQSGATASTPINVRIPHQLAAQPVYLDRHQPTSATTAWQRTVPHTEDGHLLETRA